MTEEAKKTPYELCFGIFYPMREHNTEFGWAIVHNNSKRIFGYIGSKSSCFGVCAALNGEMEAAREFLSYEAIDLLYDAGSHLEGFKKVGQEKIGNHVLFSHTRERAVALIVESIVRQNTHRDMLLEEWACELFAIAHKEIFRETA